MKIWVLLGIVILILFEEYFDEWSKEEWLGPIRLEIDLIGITTYLLFCTPSSISSIFSFSWVSSFWYSLIDYFMAALYLALYLALVFSIDEDLVVLVILWIPKFILGPSILTLLVDDFLELGIVLIVDLWILSFID